MFFSLRSLFSPLHLLSSHPHHYHQVSGALDPRQLRALLDTHLASIPAPGQHGWPARTTAPSRLLLPDGGCGLSLCAPPLPSSTSLRTENQNENAQEAPTVELRKNQQQQQRELPAKSPFAVAVPSEVQPLPSVFLGGATSPVAKRLKIAMQVSSFTSCCTVFCKCFSSSKLFFCVYSFISFFNSNSSSCLLSPSFYSFPEYYIRTPSRCCQWPGLSPSALLLLLWPQHSSNKSNTPNSTHCFLPLLLVVVQLLVLLVLFPPMLL